MRLYGVLGKVSVDYHTDILRLMEMPIDAVYFHFGNLRMGMGMI